MVGVPHVGPLRGFTGTTAPTFPVECHEVEYERRMRASYPIHPEVFDRLYEDWSTMGRFQRTRGVLRLMAAVIHELWRTNDASPLIMPGSLPVHEPRIRDELLRYLNDQWNAVLDEADGDESETARIDNENQRFGQAHAARRLARTIFLGSVPYKATRGIEDVRVLVGVVEPDQPISTYNDAPGKASAAAPVPLRFRTGPLLVRCAAQPDPYCSRPVFPRFRLGCLPSPRGPIGEGAHEQG
jgi:hypothetical protein